MAGYARKKKRKQNRLAMFAITLVVAALVGVLSIQTVQLEKKRDQYTEKLAAVEAQLAEQEARAEELEEQRIFTQTKQYIEQEAKKLGLVNPNEIILKPQEN